MLLPRYHEKRDAEDAIDALDGRQYDGRELKISMDAGRPQRYAALFPHFRTFLAASPAIFRKLFCRIFRSNFALLFDVFNINFSLQ